MLSRGMEPRDVVRRPPPTYYSLQDKQEEIRSLGQDMETFKQFGILIDKEQTDGEEEESQQFILQILKTSSKLIIPKN